MSVTWQWAKANPDAAARRIRELECENAALKIKCNKLRLALEDIEEASVDPWAKIAADRVLKEAQL